MKRRIALGAVIVSAFLMTTGCGNNNTNDEASKPSAQQPAVPQDQSSKIAERFDALIDSGAPVSDMLVFLRENKGKVEGPPITAMLSTFEAKQNEQAIALTDRYYEEEGKLQDELWGWLEKNGALPKAEEVNDSALRTLLSDTVAGGYKLEMTEGTFFPVIDYEVYREFQPYVSEDMRTYIDILALESNEPAVKDAGLVISWEQVTERALTMERFIRDYPDSIKLEDMSRLYRSYLYITFMGIDNAPLFSFEDNKLLPEVRTAFTHAVDTGDPTSAYVKDLRDFLQVVKDNGDKQTDQVMAWQEQKTTGILEEYDENYEDAG